MIDRSAFVQSLALGLREELKDTAAQIAALGEDSYGFGLQGAEIETDVYFYYALWSYGGNLIEEDGTSGLDSEAAFLRAVASAPGTCHPAQLPKRPFATSPTSHVPDLGLRRRPSAPRIGEGSSASTRR